jgi:PIN domain nuclease of toxin-antitoxin system
LGLLLDTNVIIWLASGSRSLPERVLARLLSGEEEIYVSVLSGWAYEHERRRRPGELGPSFAEILAAIPHSELPLEFEIYRHAATLPLIHKDPFGRMLVAQAIHHDLELVASDEKIHQYPARIFW